MMKLNNGEMVEVDNDDKRYALAKLLVEAMDDLGRPLNFEDTKTYPRMPAEMNAYAVAFGSLDKACKEARYFVKNYKKRIF